VDWQREFLWQNDVTEKKGIGVKGIGVTKGLGSGLDF